MTNHTIILGAGLAGLAAARRLTAAGHQVQIIDKGRSVGGRLATRRIGDARLDHGAQFFTTRGEAFTELAAQATTAGAVREWCRGFGEPDGYPRYCGATGMTDLAKWMARDLSIDLNTSVSRIHAHDGTVRFFDGNDQVLASGERAIVSAPIPQMLDLFDNSNVRLPTSLDLVLRNTNYFATLALLAVIDGEPNIAEPGGMQFSDGPFTFIANNHRKGISSINALTFHAEHDYSLRRFDDDPDEVHAELIQQAAPWLGEATIVESQLKKWRYAGPVTPLPDRTHVFEAGGCDIALAGDAFGGPKVEGAFNSGEAAAEALLA